MSLEIHLTSEIAARYLVDERLAQEESEVRITELDGGVSIAVLLIEWLNFPGRRWVIKQSLRKLRVKDDWQSDRSRIFREAEAIQALLPVLGSSVIPTVIHLDHDNYIFIMTAAPAGSVSWKEDLLAGKVNLAVARQAGSLLATMLAVSPDNTELQKQFEDRSVFLQLRIDPYYRTTAQRHSDVRGAMNALIAKSWGIRSALVHGDYSPKNMLVRDGKIFLIDFEGVHWGDPTFDAGFLLSHLYLKALHKPECAAGYFEAARTFWEAFGDEVNDKEISQTLEKLTIWHAGSLILARIDGKSSVEYIQHEETKERAREVAKHALRTRTQHLEQLIEIFSTRIG
jgi:5-methylthioribose kinase